MKMPTALIVVLLIAFATIGCAALLAKGESDSAEVHFRRPLDLGRLRDAIARVEAWDGHSVGKHGETGPLQMKPRVFAAYGHDSIAYVQWLIRALPDLGLPVTVYSAALLHNQGYDNVRLKLVTQHGRDFAVRVQNTYYDPEASGK